MVKNQGSPMVGCCTFLTLLVALVLVIIEYLPRERFPVQRKVQDDGMTLGRKAVRYTKKKPE